MYEYKLLVWKILELFGYLPYALMMIVIIALISYTIYYSRYAGSSRELKNDE
jgi:hypothetical protein